MAFTYLKKKKFYILRILFFSKFSFTNDESRLDFIVHRSPKNNNRFSIYTGSIIVTNCIIQWYAK